MLALTARVLPLTPAISIFVHFLKGWTNEMLKKRQQNYATDKYLFWIKRSKHVPAKLVIGEADRRDTKANGKTKALLIKTEPSPHFQTEILNEAMRRI
jgi:hypothetical protein